MLQWGSLSTLISSDLGFMEVLESCSQLFIHLVVHVILLDYSIL